MAGYLLTCVCLAALSSVVLSRTFMLEAVTERTRNNHEVRNVSNAHHGQAIWLKSGEPLSFNFCLREKTDVLITKFRFSNGDKRDKVAITIDGRLVGSFRSLASDILGLTWNSFVFARRFPTVYLESGWHVLKVNLTEGDGIAVDSVEIDVSDLKMTDNLFQCRLSCGENVTFPRNPNEYEVTKGYILQQSFATKCAEVDNVNIPIFHSYVQKFQVTSTLPQYKSFQNWRSENLTDCPHLSARLWSFDTVTLTGASQEFQHGRSFLFVNPVTASRSAGTITMVAKFMLAGRSTGMIDSEIGSLLIMEFQNLQHPVTVSLRYIGKSGKAVDGGKRLLKSSDLNGKWNIPDYTWTEDSDNFIALTIEAEGPGPLQLKNIRMEKRPMLPDQVFTIYKSDDVIIDAIHVDFWWLAPESMSLRLLPNGHTREGVGYLRIYRPMSWNGGYSQVFVLYQDGNARLLPITPNGVDWIPFGSSVIIGQSRAEDERPYASIKHIDLDTENLELMVSYLDGGSARMKLISTVEETKLVVDDIRFARSPFSHPFATFRSMYVTEDNNDSEMVYVDGEKSYDIMDPWPVLDGSSFAFYRKCMSHHLDLSPDIRIDILRTQTSGQATAMSLF